MSVAAAYLFLVRPMRIPSVVIMIALLSCEPCLASPIVKLDKQMLASGSFKAEPRPQYPIEARRLHITGHGIFILNVDVKTLSVKSIQIQKSTGHAILDAAAMKALIDYRFKPGVPPRVWVPVTFQMDRIGPHTRA